MATIPISISNGLISFYSISRSSQLSLVHGLRKLKFGLHTFLGIRLSTGPKAVTMGVADDLTKGGEFVRKASQFRNTICEGSTFPPEANRYHLYISLACPWAHRTLIVRKLKGLEDVISLSVVHYLMLENGWEFKDGTEDPACIPDTVNNFKYVKELYVQSDPEYNGRYTVPILYDKQSKKIVNNESSDIIRMFNTAFNKFAKNPSLDLYPEILKNQIDELNDFIYNGLNNGVYKAGFAMNQEAHELNSKLVYETLMKLDEILGKGPYVLGDTFTETDVRLFTSLVRHDAVYFGHFKCNLVAVRDLPNLSKWLKMIIQTDSIGETVNMDHIKKHYYMSHRHINPSAIVPLGI
ncbi:Glutathionyl-hydroquinone reductase YqjG [Pseudolycoriella hygida]|uniref:Glutathionyl-hydroquinone reductase YqjG n=1 Tax=Pseudolycoriella hygida TaxID=35572 RepID=A0A9Q0N0T0_9DIPT|nr:Glutathionyl-hydroquinone reductase YqjG [Pseudolycoriella hygida]